MTVCKNATNYSFPPSTPLDNTHPQWFGADLLTCFGQSSEIWPSSSWRASGSLSCTGNEGTHGAELDSAHSGVKPRQPAARGRTTPTNADWWGKKIDACCHEVWDGLLGNTITETLVEKKKKLITKQLHGPWWPTSPWRGARKYNTSSPPLKKEKQKKWIQITEAACWYKLSVNSDTC